MQPVKARYHAYPIFTDEESKVQRYQWLAQDLALVEKWMQDLNSGLSDLEATVWNQQTTLSPPETEGNLMTWSLF